jgi:type III secretion protein J
MVGGRAKGLMGRFGAGPARRRDGGGAWLRHSLRWLLMLACSMLLVGCGQEILLRDLNERDANELVGVLYASSIESTKVADGKGKTFSVSVRSSDMPRSVAVLRALGLPKSPRANLNEVFRSTGFAPTPFEERVRYLFGLAQELERTVSMMEGVLQTRVHVVTPDGSSKIADLQKSKASIFVSFDDRYDIEALVPRIRKLVSDSIEGLSPTRVEILAIPSRVDLKSVTEVPIRRVLGVRVHKDDMTLLIIEASVVIGLLLLSVGLHLLDMLRPRMRRLDRRQRPVTAASGTVAAAARSE